MLVPDHRRKLAIRLSVLEGLIAVVFTALAIGFWVVQVVQHAKFEELAASRSSASTPRTSIARCGCSPM
jgi:cell division protein FtsI/penicillin-binding protein 2